MMNPYYRRFPLAGPYRTQPPPEIDSLEEKCADLAFSRNNLYAFRICQNSHLPTPVGITDISITANAASYQWLEIRPIKRATPLLPTPQPSCALEFVGTVKLHARNEFEYV